MHSEKRIGELAAGSAALLWSLFPIVTALTVSVLSPLYAAAIGTAISAVVFALVVTWRKRWSQMLVRAAWKDMLMTTVFIGVLYYAFVFIGYRFTTPGNGAVVGLLEVFFSFLVINVITRHERFILIHALGGLCMIIGAAIILLPSKTGQWNSGDLLIAFATLMPPLGNIAAQRARKLVSGDIIMFFRSTVGALFLFVIAWFLEPLPALAGITGSFWMLLLSGVVLMGLSKLLWMEAIHRLPIAKCIALMEGKVLVTFVLAYFLLNQSVTPAQMLSVIPMLLGVFLLTRK